jgi:hypothetical protein
MYGSTEPLCVEAPCGVGRVRSSVESDRACLLQGRCGQHPQPGFSAGSTRSVSRFDRWSKCSRRRHRHGGRRRCGGWAMGRAGWRWGEGQVQCRVDVQRTVGGAWRPGAVHGGRATHRWRGLAARCSARLTCNAPLGGAGCSLWRSSGGILHISRAPAPGEVRTSPELLALAGTVAFHFA